LQKEQVNENQQRGEAQEKLAGRLIALDLGEKRVGVAVSDELHLTVRTLQALERTNWKKFLRDVAALLTEFDAKALVIGLPLSLDGTVGTAAQETLRLARNFRLSLEVPVYLQDERLTSREAEESLRAAGRGTEELRQLIDSESAAIILRDFINSTLNRPLDAS
jgi:putative Holliday junction resolvase